MQMTETKRVDEAALNELREIMGDDFRLLIDTFIGDSKLRLDAIKDAIVRGDSNELRSAAHSFKGSALNLSAGKLTALCKTLEQMGRNNEMNEAKDILNAAEEEYKAVEEFLLEII